MKTFIFLWILLILHICYISGDEENHPAVSRHIRSPLHKKGRPQYSYYLDKNNKCIKLSGSSGSFKTLNECTRNRRVSNVRSHVNRRQSTHRRQEPVKSALKRSQPQFMNHRKRPTGTLKSGSKRRNQKSYRSLPHTNVRDKSRNKKAAKSNMWKKGDRSQKSIKFPKGHPNSILPTEYRRPNGLKILMESPKPKNESEFVPLKTRRFKNHKNRMYENLKKPKSSKSRNQPNQRGKPRGRRNDKVPVATTGKPIVKTTSSSSVSRSSTVKSRKSPARRSAKKGQKSQTLKNGKNEKPPSKKTSVKYPKKGPKKMKKKQILKKAKNGTLTNGTKEKMQRDQQSGTKDTTTTIKRCKRNTVQKPEEMPWDYQYGLVQSLPIGEPNPIDDAKCLEEGHENAKETARFEKEAGISPTSQPPASPEPSPAMKGSMAPVSKCSDNEEEYADGTCFPKCEGDRVYSTSLEMCVDKDDCNANQGYDENGKCTDCPDGQENNGDDQCVTSAKKPGSCKLNYRGSNVCVVLSEVSDCIVTQESQQLVNAVDPWKLGNEMINVWGNHRQRTVGELLKDIDHAKQKANGKDLDFDMLHNVAKYLLQTKGDCEYIHRMVININSLIGCKFEKCPF